MKKGQISLLILFGLIIVIIGSFIFYFNSSKKIENIDFNKNSINSVDLGQVKDSTEMCIEKVGLEAIKFTSLNGGNYNLNNNSYGGYNIYLNDNLIVFPNQTTWEDSISSYISNQLFFCLKDMNSFKSENFEIDDSQIKVETTFYNKRVNFKVFYPISLVEGESSSFVSKYNVNIENLDLVNFYSGIEKIINEQSENTSRICLSCLSEFGDEFNFKVEMQKLKENIVLFSVISNEINISSIPLKFQFVNIYPSFECGDCETKIEPRINLSVQKIPNQNVKAGELFFYDVDAVGEGLKYSDYSFLFDINEVNGEIEFRVSEYLEGNFTNYILVEDMYGNKEKTMFVLEVTK